MRLLFNDDVNDDMSSILVFLEAIGFNEEKKKLSIDILKIRSILNGVRQDFPHNDGIKKASIFKKAAAFMVYFIAEKPIQSDITSIPNMPEDISCLPNHVNTVIAILIAFSALHGAVIHLNGTEKILNSKISLSNHSFVDLVEALSNATPSTHFNVAAVLLEQLAYKTNPDCQYQPVREW